jgi:type VI secretion system secreted protein Hcp
MNAPRWFHRALLLALALCIVEGAAPARADQAFMRMTGGAPAVNGESQVKGYENWIELDAVAWRVTAESSWTKGGGASVGKPQPGELTWVQAFDASVPAMYAYLLQGDAIPVVTVELVQDGGAGPVTFAQLVMTDAFFTALSFDDSTVHGAVVFKKLTQSVWPIGDDGARGRRAAVSWDIPAGTGTNSGDLAPFVAGYGAGNLAPAPVPEPETWVMLLVGAMIVGGVARGRSSENSRSVTAR